MGIDIYMRWPDMTEEEGRAQITGFAIDAGDRGYLREAYHGGPYATRLLVPEAFDDESDDWEEGVPIPAATMRARLPETIEAAIERTETVYNETIDETHPVVRAFVNFVELAERIEARTGEPVYVIASY